MVQDLSLTPEIVEARLRTLAQLADLLDGLLRSMGHTHKRQTTATWSAVPTCEAFAAAYTRTLGAIWGEVTKARTEVRDAADSLRLGAAALTNIDQDVQDRLQALVNRLNLTEPTPMMGLLGMLSSVVRAQGVELTPGIGVTSPITVSSPIAVSSPAASSFGGW